MIQALIKYVKPQQIYSIGTAGGATLNEMLGDVAVTNSARIELQKSENLVGGYNNQNFTCASWFPPTSLMDQVQNKLFFPLSNVLNDDAFNKMLDRLHQKVAGSSSFSLDDLINAPINPANLTRPAALNKQNVPLLTTDTYFIGSGNNTAQYSVLEMDDAVIGHEAGQLNTAYVFVRNISDPLVADTTASGAQIPQPVRKEWSDLIYELCGFYSSFNSALTAWAAIAG
jgi:nucleoside phosphorylase